jgi:hypothetical protein
MRFTLRPATRNTLLCFTMLAGLAACATEEPVAVVENQTQEAVQYQAKAAPHYEPPQWRRVGLTCPMPGYARLCVLNRVGGCMRGEG